MDLAGSHRAAGPLTDSPEAAYRALPRRERSRLARMVAVGAWSDDAAEAQVAAWLAARELRRQPLFVLLTAVVLVGVLGAASIVWDGDRAFIAGFVAVHLLVQAVFVRPRLRAALLSNQAVARGEPLAMLPPGASVVGAVAAVAAVAAVVLALSALSAWWVLTAR